MHIVNTLGGLGVGVGMVVAVGAIVGMASEVNTTLSSTEIVG